MIMKMTKYNDTINSYNSDDGSDDDHQLDSIYCSKLASINVLISGGERVEMKGE